MTVESYEIALNFRSDQFRSLDLSAFPSADWTKAIEVFKSRFKSRFFEPLANMTGTSPSEGHIHGFVVLSCTFMLVETLGGFTLGLADHKGKSPDCFKAGIEGLLIKNEDGTASIINEGQKDLLYKNGRCALLHTAGTEKIRVMTSGPATKVIAGGGFDINRDAFLNWVKDQFDGYAGRLCEPAQVDLRTKFLMKMNHIAGV